MPKVSPIFKSHSPQETIAYAAEFAHQLFPGAVVFLQGDLGAGKTTFVKGLAQALKVNPKTVNSPTFVIMNYYKGKLPIYHFDLYRLEKSQDLIGVNLDEYVYGEGVTVIEWPERLGAFKPDAHFLVELKHKDENSREICISSLLKPQRKPSR